MKDFVIGLAVGYALSYFMSAQAPTTVVVDQPINPSLPVGPQLPTDVPAGQPPRRLGGPPPKYYAL